MTLHNLCTIMTPNLFRPFEITPNDLIYASQLVEVLKMMCVHFSYIFSNLIAEAGREGDRESEALKFEWNIAKEYLITS